MSEYNHQEAFCLMQYRDKVTGETEVLWNSRDGVTPFGIVSRRGNDAMHNNWRQDVRIPDFKPAPGMRIFVDATRENMTPGLKAYIEKWWNNGENPMRNFFETKDQAFERFMESALEKTGAPHVEEVRL